MSYALDDRDENHEAWLDSISLQSEWNLVDSFDPSTWPPLEVDVIVYLKHEGFVIRSCGKVWPIMKDGVMEGLDVPGFGGYGPGERFTLHWTEWIGDPT